MREEIRGKGSVRMKVRLSTLVRVRAVCVCIRAGKCGVWWCRHLGLGTGVRNKSSVYV